MGASYLYLGPMTASLVEEQVSGKERHAKTLSFRLQDICALPTTSFYLLISAVTHYSHSALQLCKLAFAVIMNPVLSASLFERKLPLSAIRANQNQHSDKAV